MWLRWPEKSFSRHLPTVGRLITIFPQWGLIGPDTAWPLLASWGLVLDSLLRILSEACSLSGPSPPQHRTVSPGSPLCHYKLVTNLPALPAGNSGSLAGPKQVSCSAKLRESNQESHCRDPSAVGASLGRVFLKSGHRLLWLHLSLFSRGGWVAQVPHFLQYVSNHRTLIHCSLVPEPLKRALLN